MNNFNNTIGIDVSKKHLDAYDYRNQIAKQVGNNASGFKELSRWVKENNVQVEMVLWCFEHTGLYSLPLAIYLTSQSTNYAMIPGLELKRSLGISRGKNDQVDAIGIARYGFLRKEEIKIYKLPSTSLLELKSLLTLRERLVNQRAGYQASKREMRVMLRYSNTHTINDVQQQMMVALTKQIKKVEKHMLDVVAKDEQLNKIYKLVTSVKGIGPVIGISFLVYTNCFTAFTEWRKFACYCGLVPFEYQSGISIKGKKKINHLANKRMKALLSNAACTTIQHNPEMRLYYERRLKEGKNKMSTQNIIRNKIVSRVFAVVQRGTPYVETLKYAA